MYALNCVPYGCLVGKRLAHAHEHDVVDTSGMESGFPSSANNLLDNFTRCEMSIESGLTGGTESACHCAACLRAHAHGGAVFVVHQHRFNGVIAFKKIP